MQKEVDIIQEKRGKLAEEERGIQQIDTYQRARVWNIRKQLYHAQHNFLRVAC